MGLTDVPVRVRRAEVETTDVAVAEELISRGYAEYRPRLVRHPADFVFRARSASAGGWSIDRVRNWSALEATIDERPDVVVLVVTGGWYAVRDGRDDRPVAPGTGVLLPIGVPVSITWDRVDEQMVRFPIAAVTRVARRMGVEPAEFRFDAIMPVSAAGNRLWLDTVSYLVEAFDGPEPAIAQPLLRESVLESVAAAALAVFPNPTMSLSYAGGPGRVTPAAVRRAAAYLDAHAAEPVTLDDAAAAAGISVRGLHAGFARHLDISPMGYLKRVRMDGAHRDLRDGDCSRGDTVAAIARRWGFADPGRFARAYREAFGQLPGRTLRA
ncbi:AraC family transcriptional regulator [Actinoplanes sp. NPDC049548]|uniref:AraC family transcriptional regulator n=1 Tax=Actinoplanes sp. NPDC049548 TaxID=3155152 RepID=UPI003440B40B